jgi:PAS domain S-box-containing protein
LHAGQSNVFRYAVALTSVALTLGVALLTWHYGIRHQFSMFLIVVAVIAWYCRAGPAILAVICSLLAYDYFFREPAYSFSVSPGDIPNYVLSVLFTLLVVWFGTVRRRTEDALRSSEKKYRELIDASPDAIFVFDGSGKWVLSNKAAARLRGCSENELIGLSLADTYVPAERNLVQERLERVKKLGVLRYERQFLRKNNEVVPVEISMSTAAGGQYQTVARDISERKRAEQILRERADLLDLTHDTVFVRNMNNVITYWNRGAEESYGWTLQDAVGQVSYELLRTIFPEPLDDINAKLLRTGRWEGELVHTTRNGARLVVASRWSLQRDERGNPSAILETNNDVTERKRLKTHCAKARPGLEEAQRIAHVGYWERDLETDLLTWSDESFRIFGLQPQKRRLEFAALQELIHPEDRHMIVGEATELIAGGARYDVEYRVIRPDGEVRIVHSQGEVLRRRSGPPSAHLRHYTRHHRSQTGGGDFAKNASRTRAPRTPNDDE